MKLPLILLCAGLTVSSGFEAYADETADLLALLDDYASTVNTPGLDLDLAERIWNQSEDITFVHPLGHERGWEEIRRAFYIDTMGALSNRNLMLRDISIHVLSEQTAWGDFYWDFEANLPDGTPIKTTGRETQVWKNEGGKWTIVHVHYSGPPADRLGDGL